MIEERSVNVMLFFSSNHSLAYQVIVVSAGLLVVFHQFRSFIPDQSSEKKRCNAISITDVHIANNDHGVLLHWFNVIFSSTLP